MIIPDVGGVVRARALTRLMPRLPIDKTSEKLVFEVMILSVMYQVGLHHGR